MNSRPALITSISEQKNVGGQLDSAFFEETKIMFTACTEGGGKNSSSLHLRKYLRFLGMAVLFSAVLMPLFFDGVQHDVQLHQRK